MDSHWHGRMDWGLGNPNKTAALIATLMLAVWLLAYVRKWGFWLALTLSLGLGVCLALTQSRGGLVGLVVGGLTALAWVPRPYPFARILGLIAVGIGLLVFAFFVNEQTRVLKGLSGDDLSVENRLLIWKQVPEMIHDAPNGWGLGRSGDAYMQWYQPVTRGEGYRTLVNSHLTWLAELDWPGRIVYIFGWAAVFILAWPQAGHRWFSIPFAIWIAFATCASFSSVAEAPLLWGIPGLALISVLVARFRLRSWPRENVWLGGAIVSGAFLAIGWGASALLTTPSNVHCLNPGTITLGTTSPKIWLVAPNRNVLGEHYGHEARRGFETNSVYRQTGLGIVTLLKNAPVHQTLVFSGQVPSSLDAWHPAQVILINPQPAPADVLQSLLANPNIIVVVGEFSQNKDFWSQQAQQHPHLKLQLVAGSEEYISDWMLEIANAVHL